ncbi:MAG: carboxylate--amine ligase [Bacteroidetes bacterium]|nr:MAG: carboxylate--amine ligase [Bacteroidota bacterium]
MKILILDAANYNTLAIVRYMGIMKDIELHVVGYHRASLSFFSRYVSRKFVVTNPRTSEDTCYKQLLEILKGDKYDLLMPVGFQTHKICSSNRVEISKYAAMVIPGRESFELASSKFETYKLAERLGVPCPKSYYVSSYVQIKDLYVDFPVVVKAPFELGRNMVAYVNSKQELEEKSLWIKKELGLEEVTQPIIQEYVEGDGYGFFAYYEEGICKNCFMHKRIREYPATGGASVCAEGIYDEQLMEHGKKILDHLKWNGVAMVEFKKDSKDGSYKLMEINPKFWGSLELALASGVNFPLCLVKNVKGENIGQQEEYKKIRFHWLLNGELYHFLSRPLSFFRILVDLFTAKNDISLRDPLPNLMQVLLIFVHYYKRIRFAF